MSVGEIKDGALPINNAEVSAVQPVNEQQKKGGIREKILAKFAEGRDFIFKKLEGKIGQLVTLGQVGGVAAMTLGGASLIFSGIAANLTVAGIPLGIPLLIGGGILFAVGTLGLITKLATNPNSTIGQKLKDFFKITGKNVGLGLTLGAVGSGVVSQKNIKEVGSAAKDFVKEAPKVKTKVDKVLPKVFEGVGKVNNFVHPELKKMDNVQNQSAVKVEEQDKKLTSLDEAKVEDSTVLQAKKEDVEPSNKNVDKNKNHSVDQKQDGQISEAMYQEFDKKKLMAMRFFLAAYVLLQDNPQNSEI